MARSRLMKVNDKIAEKVLDTFDKIEHTVVTSYTKIEDSFVERYLAKEGESLEDAKRRLKEESPRPGSPSR